MNTGGPRIQALTDEGGEILARIGNDVVNIRAELVRGDRELVSRFILERRDGSEKVVAREKVRTVLCTDPGGAGVTVDLASRAVVVATAMGSSDARATVSVEQLLNARTVDS